MNRIRFFVTLPASVVLLAAVACTPASPASQIAVEAIEANLVVDEAPVTNVAEPAAIPAQPVAVISEPAVAPKPTVQATARLEPSTELYNELVALQSRMQPTLNAADRWVAASGAGLSAQPGELARVERELLDFQEQATALHQRARAADIDPHVQRAAEATQQQIHEFFATISLTDAMLKTSPAGGSSATGAATFTRTIREHVDRFVTLSNVADSEMATYAESYNRAHGLAN